jgi:outer membrane protein assembly factor BamB
MRILAFVVVVGLAGGLTAANAATKRPASPHRSATAALSGADSASHGSSSSLQLAAASTEPSKTSWPTFHGSPSLNGVSPDTTISTANASQLGLRWMYPTMAPMLSSPVTGHLSSPDETLAFIGNIDGYVEAINVANGTQAWSDDLAYPIYGTPTFYNGAVWVGTYVSGYIYKIDASTGQVECKVSLGNGSDLASPTVATPPGGKPTVYLGVEDNGVVSSPVYAIDEASCAVDWAKIPYPNDHPGTGSWNPTSFGVDATGVPLVFVGTGDPDSSAYAVNANTGARVWRNQNLSPSYADVGAGLTVSAPGNNGFADGMVYYPGKDRILYAINMTTGKTVWTFNYGAAADDISNGGRSAAALVGDELVFGTGVGVMAVNATTGTEIWDSQTSVGTDTEVLSSPLIMGPAGKQVVVYGDLKGRVLVLSLATGTELYSFTTHGYIVGSPADSDGNIVITSSDGFVYDLGLNGTNSTSYPETAISSPANGSTLPNPNSSSPPSGTVTAEGTATSANCNDVLVAVQQNGPEGSYWNATTGAWQAGPEWNTATLGSGGCSGGWSFSAPVGSPGAVLEFFARATDSDGEVDPAGITSRVTVSPATSAPHLKLSSTLVAPGYSLNISGGGFTAGEKVQISMPGAVLATATATSSGSLPSTRVEVPKGYAVGLSGITATGETSGKAAAAALDVAMSWAELGASPARTAYQPNDNALSQEETPNTDLRLAVAAGYDTGAAVNSSPAVSNLVAYVGNSAGDVDAISTVTGTLLWQATTGGAVNSSPAVDPKVDGLVIAGSADGNVYAFNLTTGATVWETATGGAVESSPNLVDGVVYVGSDSGQLYALNESTGAVEWTATLSGEVTASPAVDTTKGVVVVSDTAGDVEAFATGGSSPGSLLWTYTTGGAAGTPIVSGGTVYVGSADGNEYALSESTGAVLWSFPVGGTPSSAALMNPVLYVGSSDRSLFALDASTGKVVWEDTTSGGPHTDAPGPVTGVSVTAGLVWLETSNGHVDAWRDGGEIVWTATTGAGLSGTPSVVDNAVIVGAGDDNLYVYTPFGMPMT